MSIAGHVSHAMLSRYSHVRMEATRRALDEIAERQRAADAKRKEEAEVTIDCGGSVYLVDEVSDGAGSIVRARLRCCRFRGTDGWTPTADRPTKFAPLQPTMVNHSFVTAGIQLPNTQQRPSIPKYKVCPGLQLEQASQGAGLRPLGGTQPCEEQDVDSARSLRCAIHCADSGPEDSFGTTDVYDWGDVDNPGGSRQREPELSSPSWRTSPEFASLTQMQLPERCTARST